MMLVTMEDSTIGEVDCGRQSPFSLKRRWLKMHKKKRNLPLYPPLRASDILADVLTRKMKSIRVHRRRTSMFIGELPLLSYTSIHCKKAILFVLLLRFDSNCGQRLNQSHSVIILYVYDDNIK